MASEATRDRNVNTNSFHTNKYDDLAATNDDHPNIYKDNIVKKQQDGWYFGIVINREGDDEDHVNSVNSDNGMRRQEKRAADVLSKHAIDSQQDVVYFSIPPIWLVNYLY